MLSGIEIFNFFVSDHLKCDMTHGKDIIDRYHYYQSASFIQLSYDALLGTILTTAK